MTRIAFGRVLLLLAVWTLSLAAQRKPDAPRIVEPAPVSARLRQLAAARASVNALIVLKDQPQREMAKRPAREMQLAVAPSQAAVETSLVLAGGRVRKRFWQVNMLAAALRSASLDRLAANPLIAEILPLETHYAQLQNSVAALGTGTFWNAGFLGAGQSVAVLDTGVTTSNPGFSGQAFSNHIFLDNASQEPCFGDNPSTSDDVQGHGTHVAGIVASRGSSECANCRGVARGLGTLYNMKVGYRISNDNDCAAPGGGAANSGDVFEAIEWLAENTNVRILNYSYGAATGTEDDGIARAIDQLADTYGFLPIVAAGNAGPNASTVTSPGLAYNILSVANWSARGTIYNSSGRGPTIGGRSKPDLAAPGVSILSEAHNWADSGVGDYATRTGTSMATPHIAGAAALLVEAGVTDLMAVKAILINTTDAPGWASDSGWGYANLDRARGQLHSRTGTLAPHGFRFYRVTAANPLRATVTWNRHIVNGATSVFHDIDLHSYSPAFGAPLQVSESEFDNVEQIHINSAGTHLVKVKMFSSAFGGGVTAEKYAIAFSESAIDTLNGPQVQLSCSLPGGSPTASSQFTFRCVATNTGDLPLFNVSGSVAPPNGFSGNNTLSFGTLSAGGGNQTVDLTLTAPPASGTHQFTASAASTSYEETFTGSANLSVTVNPASPGAPANPSPANGATGASTTLLLTWSAVSGAASYDVYFGTNPNPPFAANRTGTSYSAPPLAGETTYYWRVVAKNVSGSTSSPTWSFTTQIVLDPPGAPSPANGASGIATTASLGWSAGASGTTFDVYFGANPTPPLVSSSNLPAYTPGPLAGGTTYYWRIVVRKGSASASSPTWAFTTVPKAFGLNPPSLLSATPSTVTGSPQQLTFTFADNDGFDNIDRFYFLVNATPTIPQNTCHGFYLRGSNTIELYTDGLVSRLTVTPGAQQTIENSQCAIHGATSALLSASGNQLQVRFGISLKGTFATAQRNVYVWPLDLQNNGTGWLQTTTWLTGNLNRPPVAVVDSVPSLTGSPQQITFAASDPDGFDNLDRIYFLVNPTPTVPLNSCHGFYQRSANAIYLYNDALNVLQGPVTPGATGVIQNSQCAIDAPTSSLVTASGTNLAVRLAMTLKGAFANTSQKVYLWAVDANGNGTGWVQNAAWGPTNLNRPPSVISGAPTAPIGSPQTFDFTLRDPDGAANIRRVYFVINPTPAVPQNTCHGLYDRVLNAVYLYNDALNAASGPHVLGAAATPQNSQCSIDIGASSLVSNTGTDLVIRLRMTLLGAFAGANQNIYLWPIDDEGNGTGWIQTGVWAANSAALTPSIVSASPANVTGSPQTFTQTSRSPVGQSNLSRIYFLVNATASVPAGSCHGFYDRTQNAFYLFNDALTVLQGPIAPGSGGTLENSQCTLHGATSNVVSAAGTDLTLNWGLSLKGAYASTAKNLYFWAQDYQGRGTGWVLGSVWSPQAVSSQPPAIVAASPANTSGTNQTFTVTGRDPNGATDIQRVYFLVNTNPSIPTLTCHGLYDRPTNSIYLYNDTLTATVGPLIPGSGGTIQNSLCTIHGAGSAATVSGTDLTLSLNITRKSSLAASAQKLYLWWVDAAQLGTGWVQVSNWN